MSDETDQGHFHVHGGLIDADDVPGGPAPGVELPTVAQITLDDDDAGVCRYATKSEIRPFYVDNPVTASPIQPDVLTLEIDDQPITFGYQNGAQFTIKLGDIDWNTGGSGASRYRKTGGIVYPTDEGGNVLINTATAPRLSGLRVYLHDQIRQRSEERVQLAELVYAFAQIMEMYGDALGD